MRVAFIFGKTEDGDRTISMQMSGGHLLAAR
jgi:hypothetical protein